MTQQVFADFIGTTPATLSGIFNDRTRPTINIVEAIKKKIPDISTDWLMFGVGQMYRSDNTDPTSPDNKVPTTGTLFTQEPMLNFAQGVGGEPMAVTQSPPYYNNARVNHAEMMREELKVAEKPSRRVTEIRVYYDDQTWESFVPSKK